MGIEGVFVNKLRWVLLATCSKSIIFLKVRNGESYFPTNQNTLLFRLQMFHLCDCESRHRLALGVIHK